MSPIEDWKFTMQPRPRPVDSHKAYRRFTKDWNNFADRWNRFHQMWEDDPEMPLDWLADWLCEYQSDLENMLNRITYDYYERAGDD